MKLKYGQAYRQKQFLNFKRICPSRTKILNIVGEVIANPGYEKLAEVSEVRFLSPMRGG